MSSEGVVQDIKEESEEKAKDAEEIKVEQGLEMKEEKTTETDPEKGTGGDHNRGGVLGFLMSKKEEEWCRALLGVRISAFVLCLVAFSLLAADKETVVLEESAFVFPFFFSSFQERYSFRWYKYDGFKYSLSITVIGFVYSGLQICELMKYLITKKHTVNPKLRGYLSVVMDQGLAYLLISASSSAASTVHIFRSSWVRFGAHQFTDMVTASVALSFIAFVAFALASIISAFILCRFT